MYGNSVKYYEFLKVPVPALDFLRRLLKSNNFLGGWFTNDKLHNGKVIHIFDLPLYKES